MVSPARRVLGEKSKNASVNIQEHDEGVKGSTQLLDAATKFQLTSPLRAGIKRRFQEVELSSFEDAREKQSGARAKLGFQTTSRPVIEETDEESESFMSSAIESHSTTESSESLQTSTNTIPTSFHTSQEPSQPIEEQFEIIQEESQRTLEKIHATPMPELKLSLVQPDRPRLLTEGSDDSVRMSSFINFDEADENQREKFDEDLEMIIPLQLGSDAEESPKAKQLLEKATMLRTRLQLAMHKVETNQTSKPFSRLMRPRSTSPELSLPPRLFSATVLPNDCLPIEHGARLSPESQIAIHRARAFRGAYQTKAIQRLNSLPIPKIVPTAYSSRYMVQPQVQRSASRQQMTEIPYSPSSHGTGGRLKIRPTKATPSPSKDAGMKLLLPHTPRHRLGSPPGSDDGGSAATDRRLHGVGVSALTSSVVKGEAANGLLELMRAGSR